MKRHPAPSRVLFPGLCLVVLAAACLGALASAPTAWAAAADSTSTGDLVLFPSVPCPNDDVTLFVRGFVATPCDSFIGAERLDDRTVRIRGQVYSTRQCFAAPFEFFSVPVVMGRFPVGANQIKIVREVIVRDEIGGVDTTRTTSMLAFTVSTTCSSSTLPADKLPFVHSVTTVPNPPCPGHPVSIHVAGVFLNGCGRVVSVDPTAFSLVISPYPPAPYPTPTPCTQGLKPWSADLPIGTLAAGHFTVSLRMTVVGSDSLWPPIPTETYTGRFDFDVPRECPSTLLPYVDFIRVMPKVLGTVDGSICPSDSLVVTMGGTFPSSCFGVVSLEPIDPGAGISGLRLSVSDAGCRRISCSSGPIAWNASWTLPPAAAGSHELRVDEARTLGCPPQADTTSARVGFTVSPAESCGRAAPCLQAAWLSSVNESCAAFIAPGDTASVVLGIASPVALAGLEGTIHASGEGFKIAKLEPIGSASGMQLTWTTTPEGNARFVLFAQQGTPIPATPPIAPAVVPVLRVTIALAPTSAATQITVSTDWDLLGSDAQGHGIPVCPPLPWEYRLPPTAVLCVEKGECDFNADGRLDVRDLVLMVHCAIADVGCPVDKTRFDCDGNGQLDLQDVMCCATELLRGPGCAGCPVDSVRPAPGIAVRFGAPRTVSGGLEVPIRIEHAALVGAARLRLRFPADRFVVTGLTGPPTWLHLQQVSGSEVSLGLIYDMSMLAQQVIDGPLEVVLRLTSRAGVSSGGALALINGEFSGHDGVALGVDLGAPSVPLGPIASVALSAARPNPFDGVTGFDVLLERAGTLEVGIYDLAGRRIASLYHGAADAGTHPFRWDGRTDEGQPARGGVYFYRAFALGKSVTGRVVLLRGR